MHDHTVSDLYEKLNAIAIHNASQTQVMQSLADTMAHQTATVERIEHILYGNGEAGLCEQVRQLADKETKRTEIEKGLVGYIVNRVVPWIVSAAAIMYAALFGGKS